MKRFPRPPAKHVGIETEWLSGVPIIVGPSSSGENERANLKVESQAQAYRREDKAKIRETSVVPLTLA